MHVSADKCKGAKSLLAVVVEIAPVPAGAISRLIYSDSNVASSELAAFALPGSVTV